jgi:hypothetical protein
VLLFFSAILSSGLSAKDYPDSLFGISPDGITLNTRSIQYAIDYISENGGGRLVFHAGNYLTGSIHLKSGVILQLQEGAVLLGSPNPFDYDRQNIPFDIGKKTSVALINGNDQHDIGITGKGIIDGQGLVLAEHILQLVRKGFIPDPLAYGRPSEANRPMIIHFYSCRQVLLKGVTLRHSACWVQAYNQCRQVWLDSITVKSKTYWNNDGIDIIDCDSFLLSNSHIESADDGICLKSLNDKMACRRIWIRHNTVSSGASAIKFGTASFGRFSNIHILDNQVFDTYRGAVALETVDGGSIEHIEVNGLQARNTGNALFLRLGARATLRTGKMDDLVFSHIAVEIIARNIPDAVNEKHSGAVPPAVIVSGLPGAMITNLRFSDISVQFPGEADASWINHFSDSPDKVPEKPGAYPEFSMFGDLPAWGMFVRHASGVEFTGLFLTCIGKEARPAILLDDVHHAAFRHLDITPKTSPKKKVNVYRSSEIRFH